MPLKQTDINSFPLVPSADVHNAEREHEDAISLAYSTLRNNTTHFEKILESLQNQISSLESQELENQNRYQSDYVSIKENQSNDWQKNESSLTCEKNSNLQEINETREALENQIHQQENLEKERTFHEQCYGKEREELSLQNRRLTQEVAEINAEFKQKTLPNIQLNQKENIQTQKCGKKSLRELNYSHTQYLIKMQEEIDVKDKEIFDLEYKLADLRRQRNQGMEKGKKELSVLKETATQAINIAEVQKMDSDKISGDLEEIKQKNEDLHVENDYLQEEYNRIQRESADLERELARLDRIAYGKPGNKFY